MLDPALYRYVWRTTRNGQIQICLLTSVVAPLAMVTLELQRRIVDHAIDHQEVWLSDVSACRRDLGV
jgi:hypothetical protein